MPEDVLAHVQRPRPAARGPGLRTAELAAAMVVEVRRTVRERVEAILLAHAPRADRRAVHAALCEQFTGKVRMELTLAIAMINGWNRLAIAFWKMPDQAA